MTWDYDDRKKVIKALDGLQENSAKALATQDKMAEAFTRMAAAMEKLASEVHELREDLSPALDKPKKLAAPATAGGRN